MARNRWSSRLVFLFAAIGSAVGLGNLWRFPYLAYEYGGGAFLLPYFIALIIIGIPMLILEFAVGQKLQKGAIGAFTKIHKKLGGIGFMAVATAFIITAYYAVVIAWSFIYFLQSLKPNLPWAGNSSAYFFESVLRISEGIGTIGGINWPVLAALAVVWIAVYFCVWKGTKSVGKIVLITMPLPIILLFILLIRAITLDGAATGIYAYLAPNFSALLDTQIWLAAASQIFFTLTLGFGVMIAYASYNRKRAVSDDALITAITNSGISIFAGFVVFAVLGYMAFANNVLVSEVATSGPGLAFVVFPQALSLMPLASLFSALFFVALFTLGLDSAFSLVEAIIATIRDKKTTISHATIAAWVCGVGFLAGIIFTTHAGLYFLDVVDHFVTNFGLIIVGLLQAIVVGWVYGAEKMREYINSTSKWKLGKWWDISIKYIIPVVLVILLINQFMVEMQANYEGYPTWAISIGWAAVGLPLLIGIWKFFSK